MKINWKVFEGSSHCEEGLAYFAMGEINTFKAFEEWFFPHMTEQAQVVKSMKGKGLKKMRQEAARAFKRITGQTVTDAYMR